MNQRKDHPLALRLLGDVANSSALLADDGSNVLGGHQQSERDVCMGGFGGHPRAWGPSTGTPTGPVARAPAIIRSPLASFHVRGLVRDVGDTQSVVLQLVPVQLLDGSVRGHRLHHHPQKLKPL